MEGGRTDARTRAIDEMKPNPTPSTSERESAKADARHALARIAGKRGKRAGKRGKRAGKRMETRMRSGEARGEGGKSATKTRGSRELGRTNRTERGTRVKAIYNTSGRER